MSLLKKQTLIGVCCAATLLDVSESAIRKRLCGTEGLTHVPKGNSARFSLILEEVIQLKSDWINAVALKKQYPGTRLKLVG